MTSLMYFVFGLNAVKLLLLLIPQMIGLSENTISNPLFQVFAVVVLAPLISAGLTYKVLANVSQKLESKKIKTGKTKNVLKVTLIANALFTALVNLLQIVNQ